MDKNYIKERTFDYISQRGATSYIDIEMFWKYLDYKYQGDSSHTMIEKNQKLIIFWYGWTNEAISILDELITENKICRRPCVELVYLPYQDNSYALKKILSECGTIHNMESINRYSSAPLFLPCLFEKITKNS